MGTTAQLRGLCQLECAIEGEKEAALQREVGGVWSEDLPRARG